MNRHKITSLLDPVIDDNGAVTMQYMCLGKCRSFLTSKIEYVSEKTFLYSKMAA